MSVTLSISDNQNGTGATATITGSLGALNTIYTSQVLGATWGVAATITGDGSVQLPLNVGYYFAYCLTAPTGITQVQYFPVTNAVLSVASRCFKAVVATLQLLNLPCTQGAYKVFDTQFANNLALANYPCVACTSEDARETPEQVMNNRDDIGHRVRLQIRDVVIRWDDSQRDIYRQWRQSIVRSFINQRLVGVIESVINRVEWGAPADVSLDTPQMVSEIQIKCITREVRGIGA